MCCLVNRRLVIVNRRFMPLAFGIIFWLPLVGAFLNSTVSVSDFSITKILPDGEIQRTIIWRGICARETIVDWGETSVALREVALDDGKKLQLIYENDNLTECVETRSIEIDICPMEHHDRTKRNIEVVDDVDWLESINVVLEKCHQVKSKVRSRALKQQIQHRRTERSFQQMMIAPGTKWCGPHRTASSYKELGGLDNVDRCCRRHDHCCRAIPPFSERYNFWNYMPFTLSHCGCDQRKCQNVGMIRKKRSRRSRREIFMIPGTQWCGRGNRATKYTNLGGFRKADACCRRHDTACPFYIPAFQTRYGLFNWGIATLMHCTCDERFRTCLKMAGTSSANFIGRIFFNVVQTKCFVLKPQKVCMKQSWWGKCERHEYKKQAHLRDNVPY